MMEEMNTYISENLMVIMLLVVVAVVVLGSERVRFMWSTIESTIGYCEQDNESLVSTEGGEFQNTVEKITLLNKFICILKCQNYQLLSPFR